jgi:hypothetical protein
MRVWLLCSLARLHAMQALAHLENFATLVAHGFAARPVEIEALNGRSRAHILPASAHCAVWVRRRPRLAHAVVRLTLPLLLGHADVQNEKQPAATATRTLDSPCCIPASCTPGCRVRFCVWCALRRTAVAAVHGGVSGMSRERRVRHVVRIKHSTRPTPPRVGNDHHNHGPPRRATRCSAASLHMQSTRMLCAARQRRWARCGSWLDRHLSPTHAAQCAASFYTTRLGAGAARCECARAPARLDAVWRPGLVELSVFNVDCKPGRTVKSVFSTERWMTSRVIRHIPGRTRRKPNSTATARARTRTHDSTAPARLQRNQDSDNDDWCVRVWVELAGHCEALVNLLGATRAAGEWRALPASSSPLPTYCLSRRPVAALMRSVVVRHRVAQYICRENERVPPHRRHEPLVGRAALVVEDMEHAIMQGCDLGCAASVRA